MDLGMLNLLVSSTCPPNLYHLFAGVTRQQLMDMSFLQVNEKLQETFPMELSEDRSGFIRSIIDALQSGAAAEVIHQSEQVELPNGSTLKQEIPDMDSQTHSSSAATTFENDGEGDGDIEIVGEVINGEVTFIGRKLKEQPEVLLLEDDDLEESDVSFGVPSPATGPSSSASRKRKRKRKISDPVYIRLSARSVQKRVSKKKLRSSVGYPVEFAWRHVNLAQLETRRKEINSLECEDWAWKKDSSKQATLLKIIQPGGPCSGISELSILSNSLSKMKSPPQLDLPNLTRLTAHQKGNQNINYSPLLISIIQASKLKVIEFSAENEIGNHAFLQILAQSAASLASLKILSLRNDLALVALSNTEISSLSQMQFVGLEELNLDFSLSADVKLEPLLANFAPSLETFTVAGCYTTDASVEPRVHVDVPHMPCLEVFELGHGVRFGTNYETTDRRPPKRKSRSFRVEPQMDSDASVVRQGTTLPTNTTAVGMFKVSLSLPTLPKLRTLNLASYFALQGFHFSLFPALETFQVGSDWHLSLPNKPIPVSERKVYNKLKTLGFPYRLVDHTFMHKIPMFFPNLESLVLCFPSVKVLRALAKTMKDVKSFKSLRVFTQFDFASSLDYCFLPNSTKFSQTEEEIEKVQTLKEYKHHQDYVAEYHIQLPSFDADGEEFEGLGVLKEKLKGRGASFSFYHVSRTLRLPKGNYHWNDDRCEFTDTLIGFDWMPISDDAFEHFPPDFDHMGFEHPKLTEEEYIPAEVTVESFGINGDNFYCVKKDEAA